MRAQHWAIDGSIVTIEGAFDLSAPVTTMGRLVSGYVIHELTVGPVEDIDTLLASRPGGTNEEFSYRDGTLRIASVDETDPGTGATSRQVVATWSLGDRAISGSFPGLRPEAVVAVLDTVDVQVDGSEVSVVPRDSRWHDDPQVVKDVTGLGLMNIRPLTREHSNELPAWRGATVEGGDLYRIDEREDAPALLLVSPTASTQVLLDERDNLDTAAGAASAVTVEWQQAAS